MKYLNFAYYDMLGFARNQRKSYFDANTVAAVYPDDMGTVNIVVNELTSGEDRTDFSYRTLNSKNELVWVRLHATVIDRSDGKITVFCAIST